MNEAFVCPRCGGPLTYTSGATVICPFCGNSVIVPKDLKTRLINPALTQRAPASTWKLAVAIPVLSIAFAGFIVAVGLAVWFSHKSPLPQPNPKPLNSPPSSPLPPKKPENTFATVALKFGSKGIGAGMFNDARDIGIDGAGKIYVGDYTGGRVQVFDQSGTFIKQWMVDTKMPLLGLAADRQGQVYIVQHGAIYRYDGETGISRDHLDAPGNNSFNDVVVTPDGGLLAATNGISDDIIRYNAEGKPNLTIRKAISSQTDSSELDTHVAVDGLGNIYALGTFSNAVFKFNREGKFQNKFGGRADNPLVTEPGQLSAPSYIAVDGQGRVYVSDFNGIQVFDSNGRFLATIKPGGALSAMAFNDKDELFVAAREHVIKLTINK